MIPFERSFASHEKAKYWSKKNKENPRDVFKSSGKKYWFDCECGHEFNARLSNITFDNTWCSYCANKKLCNNKECNKCYEKSFASHEKTKYWSKKNKENSRDVFKGSSKKYWFDCKCGHEFDARLFQITSHNTRCSYCGNIKLCKNNECNSCYEKSFASHEKAKYWSKKNDENPRDVFKNSHKKYWFDCECGHEFDASLYNIIKGCWCSYCGNNKLCKNNLCKNYYEKPILPLIMDSV